VSTRRQHEIGCAKLTFKLEASWGAAATLKSHAEEQETIRQYLLGLLPPEELPQVEERLLTDSAFYEELLIVEDELIDEYFAGDLSQSEREGFETHFMLAPERQGKARFARTLKKYVSVAGAAMPHKDITAEESSEDVSEVAAPPPKKTFFSFLPFRNPIVSYSLAAAILLVVGGVSWVVFRNWGNPAPREPGKVLAVTLTPGLTRDGGEIKKISVPPGTDTVQLQLALPSHEYQSYEAVLQDAEGRTLMTKKNVKAQSANGRSAVFVDVTRSLIPPGDYRVKLSGVPTDGEAETVGSYSFRVLNK
jgi:hypothetical protein